MLPRFLFVAHLEAYSKQLPNQRPTDLWDAMRLLSAHTLEITNYFGNIPPYAILSHTWGDEEVSFQDFQTGSAAGLKGYGKILGCCKQVIADSLEYVWIDTCCIDKSSSSELQEAINSMFNFYRDAAVCYAYLEDVDGGTETLSLNSSFSKSRWFTRGWTLQELLAPSLLEFYASDWTRLGTRDELKKTVALITRIDQDFFTYGKLSYYSIAQKFSWASGRHTTRVEDEAYCLLGVFGVSMPLLYGEGRRAFLRLQEELMRASDDQSIFAWSTEGENPDHKSESGLFASSPAAFAGSGNIIKGKQDFSTPPYSITNKGISIYLPLIEPESGYAIPFAETHGGSGVVSIAITPTATLAILNCQTKKNKLSRLAIFIEQTDQSTRYSRTNPSMGLVSIPLGDIRSNSRQCNLLIQAHVVKDQGWTSQKRGQLVILTGLPTAEGFKVEKINAGLQYHVLSNGAISFHMPTSTSGSEYELGKVNLEFENQNGRAFTAVVTSPSVVSNNTINAEILATRTKFVARNAAERQAAKKGALDFIKQESIDAMVELPVEQLNHAVKISFPSWKVLEKDIMLQFEMGVRTSVGLGNFMNSDKFLYMAPQT